MHSRDSEETKTELSTTLGGDKRGEQETGSILRETEPLQDPSFSHRRASPVRFGKKLCSRLLIFFVRCHVSPISIRT